MATSTGGYALSGRVSQSPDGFKKMIIPFLVEYPGGARDVKLLLQEKPVQEFGFALTGKPSSVKVDPSGNNLAVYK